MLKNDNIVIIGGQWGDEGKAKIVDYLAEKKDIVVRYQGGANAGHTVYVNNEKYVFHLIPSGIIYKDKICVIGNGVVLDLESMNNEIEMLKEKNIDINGRFFISGHSHLVLPYHKIIDSYRENTAVKKIGTTKKGIGPAYEDKVSRVGIRLIDIYNDNLLKERLENSLEQKKKMYYDISDNKEFDFDYVYDYIMKYKDLAAPFIIDTTYFLNEKIAEGKTILFEGAQGTMLDIDHGTFPYVTSSHTTSGGVASGTGVSFKSIGKVIGLMKSYITRVGNGPFPTELFNEIGDEIRSKGQEYGATTGRPRRIGWFDGVLAHYSKLINGIDYIALTRLDILSGLKKLKIAVAYEINNKKTKQWPLNNEELEKVNPIYEEYDGWDENISKCKTFEELPENAKKYIRKIEELTQAKIGLVSVGPNREETIILDEYFR